MSGDRVRRIFGLPFRAVTLEEAAVALVRAAERRVRTMVITPNVDHVVTIHQHPDLRPIYETAQYVVADGMPLVWLSKILPGPSLPERVTGTDLLFRISELAPHHRLRLFFLGGLPGVADQAARRLQERIPGLEVSGTYSPPFGFEADERESDKIVDLCNRTDTDVLFVGVGAPKQERWVFAHMERLNVGPMLCVGAALDFAAGTLSRAPEVWQKRGLEWAWRLKNEPRRLWKRYLVKDSLFVYLAARELFHAYSRRS